MIPGDKCWGLALELSRGGTDGRARLPTNGDLVVGGMRVVEMTATEGEHGTGERVTRARRDSMQLGPTTEGGDRVLEEATEGRNLVRS